jgi:hypothetical protein
LHDLPELREHIRARRAALAGFMEQGASLALDGDLLRVIPRNDIYIRYLNDNRASIGELASELYGRKLRVEVSLNGGAAVVTGSAEAPPMATAAVAPSPSAGQPAAPMSVPALAAAATDAPLPQARSIATDRQALYADPVVRRIFEEFQGRLVDVRERPAAAPPAPPAEGPAAPGASANNEPEAPAMRRPSQE